jgi:hypothetical protein
MHIFHANSIPIIIRQGLFSVLHDIYYSINHVHMIIDKDIPIAMHVIVLVFFSSNIDHIEDTLSSLVRLTDSMLAPTIVLHRDICLVIRGE